MQFILTGKNSRAKIVFKYDLNGRLTAFECEGIDNENQLKYLFWNEKFPFPYLETMIPAIEKLGKFNITKVEDDLSFERFWIAYDYKVSRKKAEKLYSKLTKAQRIKVFLHLPKYNAYLRAKGIEKAYPDTYLRNDKFEDEY
ncbi:MAG: hypothetical protein Q8O72_10520 [Bacteroidales bacterium]|nr:hypothetical protein [Bacteroidales bacterium]